MTDFKVVRLCKEEAMTIVPTAMARYDLERVAAILRGAGHQVDDKGVMVTAALEGKEVTIYPTGRMLVAGIGGKEEASQVAEVTYALIKPAREPWE